jgi:Ca2+-binding RTX toxin-like protein
MGGSGTDILDYSAEPTHAISVNLNLSTIDTNESGAGTLTFSSTEQIVGTTQNDTFSSNASFNTMTLNGGDGSDSLSFSSIVSSATAVTLTGTGVNPVMTVTGSAATLTLQNFESITGGAGNDQFIFGDANPSLTLDGGTGTDHLNFAAASASNSLTFDLQAGTVIASDFSAGSLLISHIENVTGGQGSDTFTGDTQNNTFVDAAGDEMYLGYAAGGFGSDVIQDSSGSDTLIFGDFLGGFSSSDASDWTFTGGTGNDLLITLSVADGGGSISIHNYFSSSAHTGAGAGEIENIQFSDTTWSFSDIQALI